MKTNALAFAAFLAGLAATSVRADSGMHFGINLAPRSDVYVTIAGATSPSPFARALGPVRRFSSESAAQGGWQEVLVKTWVPARWAVVRDRRGRLIRVLEPGHFVYVTDRIWTDGGSSHRNHRR